MTKAKKQITEAVENNIPRKENRYVIYFLYRKAGERRTYYYVYGRGYLKDRFDIWNLEENGFKSKSAAEKRTRRWILDDQACGTDLAKASVVKYELAWGQNERGCERPIYMKKVDEYVIYEKGDQE